MGKVKKILEKEEDKEELLPTASPRDSVPAIAAKASEWLKWGSFSILILQTSGDR